MNIKKGKHKTHKKNVVWNDGFIELDNYLADSVANISEMAKALGYGEITNIEDAKTLLEQDIRQGTSPKTTAQIDNTGVFMRRVFSRGGLYITERSVRVYFPFNIKLFVKVVQAFRDDCMYTECAIHEMGCSNE